MTKSFQIIKGLSPIVMAAIHDGHHIREELYPYLNLSEHERAREEDPYTAYLTEVAQNRIIVDTSRFEVDLNRPKDQAIYTTPEQAWGLDVWKNPLPKNLVDSSLDVYESFYAGVADLLRGIIKKFGYFLVLDLHTYNHRRENPLIEASPIDNPEINIGLSNIQPTWYPLVEELIKNLVRYPLYNHVPDVRENVKFKGGEFSRWINQSFGQYGCSIAIEFKKTFMDEWTGRVNIHHLKDIRHMLALTLPRLKKQLELNYSVK
jgi:N-formylglutamate amidohydrolase